jgi:acyl-CoA reductase-like NAD-dependent aldehyde dehydrogenase
MLLLLRSPAPPPTTSDHTSKSTSTACTREEVDAVFKAAKGAQQAWAKVPLWQRAQLLHKVASLMRQHAQPMADCLVKEIAKPAKDALTEVIRSADLIDYTAEEGLRRCGCGAVLPVREMREQQASSCSRQH